MDRVDLLDDGRRGHGGAEPPRPGGRAVEPVPYAAGDEVPGEEDSPVASPHPARPRGLPDGLAVASLLLAIGAVLSPSTSFYLFSLRSGAFYRGEPSISPVRTFLGVTGGHLVFAVAAVLTGALAARLARGNLPRELAACARGGVLTGLVVLALVVAGALLSYAFPPAPLAGG